ncbi:DNA primase small subunit domain-containing protein [Candidatus Nitrosotenuis aquarius]|uniref:DNA primase small subunit domain-containing protein n=1 Tax=Candidatus Nitrosotenuis aquarius TaxID=1846278 RepID=UPI000C1DCAA3|nr:DNA primase small subunit domain-containing protein [Candidatus Nitrosotenuis aquarius]
MHDKDVKFLEDAFKKYYFDHFDLIHTPKNPEMREFGYQKFNSGMTRHISLKSDKELHLLLMKNIPSDVYCSNARYSFPNLPMAEKDWQNADLIFDIDAKDLQLPCRQNHTIKKCTSCGNIGNSESCTQCNATKFDTVSVLCNDCIAGAKKELNKLITILTNDLGIPRQNITVYFSGNEGFHVHVTSAYETLDSRHRAELVDYLTFRGAIPETFGARTNFAKSVFPDLDDKGWLGRVSKAVFGAKSNKAKISKQIISEGYFPFKKKIESLQKELGAQIDPNVTIDVHRIFRLGGTINSKSGLTKTLCTDIAKFNPGMDACFIDESEVSVLADCPVSFRLRNKKFGPYHKERTSVPKYAAVYMICKGCASVS